MIKDVPSRLWTKSHQKELNLQLKITFEIQTNILKLFDNHSFLYM